MENYENSKQDELGGQETIPAQTEDNAEWMEMEIIEAEAVAKTDEAEAIANAENTLPTEEEPTETDSVEEVDEPDEFNESDELDESDELEKEAADDEDDDIFAVAEQISKYRRPVVVDDTPFSQNDGTVTEETDTDIFHDNDDEVYGSLFYGFTKKKTLVTVVASLITVLLLVATSALAVSYSNDKTVRGADFSPVYQESSVAEAKRAAAERAKTALPEKQEANEQFKVHLDFYDRDDMELYTTKMTINDMVKTAGIVLEEGEEFALPTDTMIASSVTLQVDKFEYTTDVVTETIPYEKVVNNTDLIPRGTTQITQQGIDGVAETTYRVRLKNGEEISREQEGSSVTQYPQTEISSYGTGGSFVGADGVTYTYSYRRIVTATYYYIPNDPYTYLGNHPDHSTIAVDMNVIPLGTWLYVKNGTYDFGLRQAQDIGGAIKGDMIDIWLDGTEAGYESFKNIGIHYDMEVYYVD